MDLVNACVDDQTKLRRIEGGSSMQVRKELRNKFGAITILLLMYYCGWAIPLVCLIIAAILAILGNWFTISCDKFGENCNCKEIADFCRHYMTFN